MTDFQKICKAVKKDDTRKLGELLQDKSVIINQRQTKSGKTLVQIAIQNEAKQSFDLLLHYPGLDVQLGSNDGQFPLQTAIILNNTYFVTKLLEQHLNPRKRNAEGDTALHVAIKNQTNADILKKLVHYNFDINEKIQGFGSYMNLAVVSNQTQNFMFLLNQPTIKIETRDQQGNTCLMLAVQHNKGDIVVAILQKIGNEYMSDIQKQFFINAQNRDGNTAIHLAFVKDLQTIAQILIRQGNKFGIDVTIQNKKGMTIKQIQQQNKKDVLLRQEAQRKKKQEKKQRQRQKQQQKQRQIREQERAKVEQKKKKKQLEKLALQIENEKAKQNSQKNVFILIIGIITLIGLMYLAFQFAVDKKKIAKTQF